MALADEPAATTGTHSMRFEAVIFDYYGTLAEHDGGGVSVHTVLAEFGYRLDPELARQYWQDGLDGTEHLEPSQSREHYTAWQRERLHSLLRESGIPEHHHETIGERLRAPEARGRMVAYPDTHAVLDRLGANGLCIAICSNWDWDLRESLDQTGLAHVEHVVSSAWIGARKPHRRIYEHTLALIGVAPERALFVGDTWNCDVVGPAALGMTPVYVRRPHREHDHTYADGHRGEYHRGDDLSVVLAAAGVP